MTIAPFTQGRYALFSPVNIVSLQNQGVTYTRYFPAQLSVCLRPFLTYDDVQTGARWLMESYSLPGEPMADCTSQLQEVYETMVACSYARSFLCLINNKPVCQVDITLAGLDGHFPAGVTEQGDYLVLLLPKPGLLNEPESAMALVQTCLEYLFLYAEVNRIFIKVHEEAATLHYLLSQAGFQLRGFFKNDAGEIEKIFAFTRSRNNRFINNKNRLTHTITAAVPL